MCFFVLDGLSSYFGWEVKGSHTTILDTWFIISLQHNLITKQKKKQKQHNSTYLYTSHFTSVANDTTRLWKSMRYYDKTMKWIVFTGMFLNEMWVLGCSILKLLWNHSMHHYIERIMFDQMDVFFPWWLLKHKLIPKKKYIDQNRMNIYKEIKHPSTMWTLNVLSCLKQHSTDCNVRVARNYYLCLLFESFI